MNISRDKVLDITKGIAIILVVIGHNYMISVPIRHLIYSFHMPLFFLISGYLYKPKSVKASLIRDVRYLLVPYFITCALAVAFYCLTYLKSGVSAQLRYYFLATFCGSGIPHECKIWANLPIIGAIWFLPALFICKNVYNALPVRRRLLLSAILFIASTLLGRYVIFLPFSALCGLSAIIFYAIGDYFKKVQKVSWLCLLIGIVCWGASLKFSNVLLVSPKLDLYFIDVIGATTISFLIYKTSKRIDKIPVLSDSLALIGKCSLYVLCIHMIDQECQLSRRLIIYTDLSSVNHITNWAQLFLPFVGALLYYYVRVKICKYSK